MKSVLAVYFICFTISSNTAYPYRIGGGMYYTYREPKPRARREVDLSSVTGIPVGSDESTLTTMGPIIHDYQQQQQIIQQLIQQQQPAVQNQVYDDLQQPNPAIQELVTDYTMPVSTIQPDARNWPYTTDSTIPDDNVPFLIPDFTYQDNSVQGDYLPENQYDPDMDFGNEYLNNLPYDTNYYQDPNNPMNGPRLVRSLDWHNDHWLIRRDDDQFLDDDDENGDGDFDDHGWKNDFSFHDRVHDQHQNQSQPIQPLNSSTVCPATCLQCVNNSLPITGNCYQVCYLKLHSLCHSSCNSGICSSAIVSVCDPLPSCGATCPKCICPDCSNVQRTRLQLDSSKP